jgi:ABC-type bacteriocin/lantibiotic exporter with double-glycine peptidase domain
MTCVPAATAMLLNQAGVEATEGELAYLSDTSLFGTTLHGMRETIDLKIGALGLRSRVETLDYDQARRLQAPFVGHCTTFGIKGHAVYVERLDEETAWLIDPLVGHRQRLPRREFNKMWTGRSLWLAADANP